MENLPQGFDVTGATDEDRFEEFKGILEVLSMVFATIAKRGDVRSFDLLLQAIVTIATLSKKHLADKMP